MRTMTRYEREKLVIIPGDFSSLPDLITTKELVIFEGKSKSTICRLAKDYDYLFTRTSPRMVTKKNYIKIRSMEVPTDKERRQEKRRKERIQKKCSKLSESYF